MRHRECFSSLGIPEQMTTNQVVENNQNVFSHRFGGQESKVKVSGHVPYFSDGSRGGSFLPFELLVASGVLGL